PPARRGAVPRGRQPSRQPRGGGEPIAPADRRRAAGSTGVGTAATPAAELRRSAVFSPREFFSGRSGMAALAALVGMPVIVFWIGIGSAQEKKLVDDDVKKLQGAWGAVSIEWAGGKNTEEVVKKVKFVFKDNGLTIEDGSVPDPKEKGKRFGVKSFRI